ncbi:VMAP-C domain-containing protein [Streptomyces gilvus]|uniref:VMAP-C domain-containing protein n=1 Tax=Streptomyces gilvus TaxID=2920937 RepID=UPI001F0FF57B|nr:hypothetical protein [Streptomyces sp. CME 23]MCH5676895.1 hypothetical protein [Streptomyces sp. CME 23]
MERVRNELVAGIVDVLQDSPSMREPASQEVWCRLLEDELGMPVEPHGEAPLRAWLLRVALACSDAEDGLSCLARSLDYVEEQPGPVAALWPFVDEWEAVRSFRGADLRRVRPVLSSARSWPLSAMARRASRSRVQELPAWCQTPWQVFLRLAREESRPAELPPSLAFLALCAEELMKAGSRESAELLHRFNRDQATRLRVEHLLAQWRQEEFTQPEPSLTSAYLVIQFEPDRHDADRYYVSHWRQADSAGWHPVRGETVLRRRDELPAVVGELIEATEGRWADLRQLVTLEFILPPELLNEPVEWWPRESDASSPTPLIIDYQVVVRSLERLRRAGWHRPWHNKWRQLQDRPRQARSVWSRPGDTSHLFHVEHELKTDADAVCLVLSEPPSDPSGVGHRELLAGLRAGIPAMIWHRSDCSDPQFQDAVADLVQGRSLSGLVERVGKWRKDALVLGPEAWDQHVGRHLAILFDDPERQPVPSRASEAWQPTVPAAPTSEQRRPTDAAGAETQQERAADAAEVCRVHISLLGEPPVTSVGSRLSLRVVPGPAHPWSDMETAGRPLLAVTAAPLTPAALEPATALLRPSERDEDAGEFTFVARHPGRHVVRFTVCLERTGTVLQQVETEFDVLAGDFPSNSTTHSTVPQRGGSGR